MKTTLRSLIMPIGAVLVLLAAGSVAHAIAIFPASVQNKTPVPVVYSTVLVDGEAQADIVAQQFRKADVDILVCVPDTWAFPQLTTISLLQQFPADTPINITCVPSSRANASKSIELAVFSGSS
jgi:hypothetical protein